MENDKRTTGNVPVGDTGSGRIAPLGSLDDFEVADNFPDPRGWDVVLADGTRVGKVHELIVDTAQLRTRYLDVSLDRDAIRLDDDRDVLIPVGAARLDDSSDNVILDSVELRQLSVLPAFNHDDITRDYESTVMSGLGSTDNTTEFSPSETDFYRNRNFDDSRFYGKRWEQAGRPDAGMMEGDEARVTRSEEELAIAKRRVAAGEVSVEKQVETEHVSQPVTVRREEVSVERRPVTEARLGSDPRIGEDEIVVPVTEEELLVEKRPVVKEEIVIKKHAVEHTEEVDADLRKERVDIDDSTRHDNFKR